MVEFLAESGLAGSRAPGSDVEPVVSLANADLSGANLEGAEGVTAEELEEQAKSLEGTTMPDGTEND